MAYRHPDTDQLSHQHYRAAISRFLRHAVVSADKSYNGTACWESTSPDKAGYGRLGALGEAFFHRLAYRLFIGEIPKGLHVDHLCNNRSCGNPLHLEAITGEENRRRRNEAQTHCKYGHPFTPENTYIYRDPKWNMMETRKCRICSGNRAQKFREKYPERVKENNRKAMARRKGAAA